MTISASRPRHPVPLRVSLTLGAAYDAGFALLMIAAPRPTARLLRLPLPPLPEGAFYLWLMAVLLLMLAALYLLACRDLERYGGIVAVAAGGRILGGIALLAAAASRHGLAGLYPLAAADLAFGLSHAALWGPRAHAAGRPRGHGAFRRPPRQ